MYAQTPTAPPDDSKAPQPQPPKIINLSFRFSTQAYGMGYVNQELRRFGNKPIRGGTHVFVALPLELSLPVAWPIKQPTVPVFPFLEYMTAASGTTHTLVEPNGETKSTNVHWSLHASGVSWGPTLPVKHHWYVRPTVGLYWLETPFNSRVAISDRPGRLDFTGRDIGWTVAVGRKIPLRGSGASIDIEGGYRRVHFTDVQQVPNGGFSPAPGLPPAQPSTLPGSINFSGAYIGIGVSWQHTLPQPATPKP